MKELHRENRRIQHPANRHALAGVKHAQILRIRFKVEAIVIHFHC